MQSVFFGLRGKPPTSLPPCWHRERCQQLEASLERIAAFQHSTITFILIADSSVSSESPLNLQTDFVLLVSLQNSEEVCGDARFTVS